MPQVDKKYLQILRDAGLCVSKPFVENHSIPSGVKVSKPISTNGNSIPNFKFGFGGTEVDAPTLYFFIEQNKWIVYLQEGIPSMEDGDFLNTWDTPEEAVQDILDYYLGNPERMQVKADRWNKV